MKRFLFILFLFPFSLLAQYKGIWNGYINNEAGGISNYILDIKYETDDVVKGDAYIYKKKYDTFEGRLNFIGVIKNKKLYIKELKILYNKMPNDSTLLCFKNMELELIPKNGIENLTGPWTGTTYDYVGCLPGDVFLRRFVSEKPNGFEEIPNNLIDSLKESASVPDTFISTSLSAPKVVEVKSRFVQISIKDYEKVDGDIISVFLNRHQIIKNHELKRIPIDKRIRLDRSTSISELIIFAENVGRIPPNTCMMIVDDGFTKQEVYIESSLQKSAVIYLKYNPHN